MSRLKALMVQSYVFIVNLACLKFNTYCLPKFNYVHVLPLGFRFNLLHKKPLPFFARLTLVPSHLACMDAWPPHLSHIGAWLPASTI